MKLFKIFIPLFIFAFAVNLYAQDNSLDIDKQIDAINSKGLDAFVKESQEKLGVKAADELGGSKPINYFLGGSNGNYAVREISATNGETYIIKRISKPYLPLDEIRNAQIVNLLKCGKEAYLLPEIGADGSLVLVMKKAPGLNLYQVWLLLERIALGKSLNKSLIDGLERKFWITSISKVMGKQYTTLDDALYAFSQVVLKDKQKLYEISWKLDNVFDDADEIQIMVSPAVNGQAAEWNVIDVEDFSYDSYTGKKQNSAKKQINKIVEGLENYVPDKVYVSNKILANEKTVEA